MIHIGLYLQSSILFFINCDYQNALNLFLIKYFNLSQIVAEQVWNWKKLAAIE